MDTLLLDNDNWIRTRDPLKNAKTGAFFTGAATVTAKLNNAAGVTVVTGQTMDFVADGHFDDVWDKALLPSSTISPGPYYLVIDAVEGGADAHWDIPVMVAVRGRVFA